MSQLSLKQGVRFTRVSRVKGLTFIAEDEIGRKFCVKCGRVKTKPIYTNSKGKPFFNVGIVEDSFPGSVELDGAIIPIHIESITQI